MDFSVKTGGPEKQRTDCLVLGIFESRRMSEPAQQVDEASRGRITAILKSGDLTGKLGQTLLLQDLPGVGARRVLLVGCGKQNDLDALKLRKIYGHAVRALRGTGASDAVLHLNELDKDLDAYTAARHATEVAEHTLYRFEQLKTKNKSKRLTLKRLALSFAERKSLKAARQRIRHGQAIVLGMNLARDLGNLPANHCTPSHLAEKAKEMERRYKALRVKVLDENHMKRLKMGALLSVAQGSHQPAKLIVFQYHGAGDREAPYALVGKGVTFDTGGISIKPAQAMDEMKYDMCGAASVFGTLTAVCELALPINVVGIVPATENMPGGAASKPGDVVTSMSGQTIEILNTDAEGRLILCDALTYAERYKPKAVLDIATLTGACVIALGPHATGLLSNNDALADALLGAGSESCDRAWRLPLWEEYQRLIDSPFADMANVGGREAGTITAACFLARFTRDYAWAHLDIAGTAWLTGKNKGATGRPVALLTQYLLHQAGSN